MPPTSGRLPKPFSGSPPVCLATTLQRQRERETHNIDISVKSELIDLSFPVALHKAQQSINQVLRKIQRKRTELDWR